MSEGFPGITNGFVGTIPRRATFRSHFVRPFQVDSSLNVYPERQKAVKSFGVASFSHATSAFFGQAPTHFLINSALDYSSVLSIEYTWCMKEGLHQFAVSFDAIKVLIYPRL